MHGKISGNLCNTKAVTKQDGSLECLYEYRAFGEELKKLGTGDAKYTYGGKELDNETNLYYFNARYYDATIGRFINVDPIQDGYNWYVYCGNNPLSFVDPTGLEERNIFQKGWDLVKKTNNSISEWYNKNEKAIGTVTTAIGIAQILAGIVVEIGGNGGGAALCATGVGSLGGVPIIVVSSTTGAALINGGILTVAAGLAMMSNGNNNDSNSQNEALRKAKENNNIPKSQQPDKTIKPGTEEGDAAGLDNRNIKQFEYTNNKSEKITIRHDKPTTYNDGGTQPEHFNSGKTGEKLDQHYNITTKK